MKYLDEYRDPAAARALVDAIHRMTRHPWTIMEVCGGQTHSIVRYGIDELIPETIRLIHGPGCPVCVTAIETIDRAIAIASKPDVIFCSFGDMLRVPGTRQDLLSVKAQGADIRIVYAPTDALRIARENPGKDVVFFAVGFETTAPANALSVYLAHRENIRNYSMLVSHVLVPPAIELILSSRENRVQGFLAAGHVCTVMGYYDYEPIAERYRTPIVVTGFEPLDILQGIYKCVEQLENGAAFVDNQYRRVVRRDGNPEARKMIGEIFEITDRVWRGIGRIPDSGYRLRETYAAYDAALRFDTGEIRSGESSDCISGLVLQGIKKPQECPAFGKACTPEHPLGATMVSGEGACAAYYNYRHLKNNFH